MIKPPKHTVVYTHYEQQVLSDELAQVSRWRAAASSRAPRPRLALVAHDATATLPTKSQSVTISGDESGRSSREKRVRNYDSVAFTTCQ